MNGTAALIAMLLAPGIGRTEPPGSAISIVELPTECRDFTWMPADARDDTLGWNQLLSLASCFAHDPTLAPDGVTQHMVHMAREMLQNLPNPDIEDREYYNVVAGFAETRAPGASDARSSSDGAAPGGASLAR